MHREHFFLHNRADNTDGSPSIFLLHNDIERALSDWVGIHMLFYFVCIVKLGNFIVVSATAKSAAENLSIDRLYEFKVIIFVSQKIELLQQGGFSLYGNIKTKRTWALQYLIERKAFIATCYDGKLYRKLFLPRKLQTAHLHYISIFRKGQILPWWCTIHMFILLQSHQKNIKTNK